MVSRSFRLCASVCSLALSGIVVTQPAMAADVIFSLTGSSSTSGSDGNSRTYSATSGSTTVNVRATGWSLTAPNAGGSVYDSYLGAFSNGLGVTSGDETGSGNTHTTDNQNRFDFIVLQFDQAVRLVSGSFTAYSLGGFTDNDATIGFGTTNLAWNSQPALNNQSYGTLTSLFNGGFTNQTGSGSSASRAISNNYGNIWLVGASFANADGKFDAFKFSGATVRTAVPEPATWAMMIIGFGLTGAAMRRRKVQTTVSYA